MSHILNSNGVWSEGPKNHLNLIILFPSRSQGTNFETNIFTFFFLAPPTERAIPHHPRPAQLAELSRSKFNPELFSHSAYDKFFVWNLILETHAQLCMCPRDRLSHLSTPLRLRGGRYGLF